ncbi:MAG: UDP-N-acetylmuramate dehydrogenase [Gemmatimonadaceae bacterium]
MIAALAPALGADRLRRDAPLAPYTTFRIGGPADVLYDATTADELASAVLAARQLQIPVFVLGLGANILVGDGGVRGLVVRNRADRVTIGADGGVRAESGAVVADLIRQSVAAGWSGLEHYVGIPSTVGGAVWQNLHFLSPAPARERTMFIEEVVTQVELLTPTGARTTADRAAMAFGYDVSRLHTSGEIALAVHFALERADPADLHRVLQENLAWRGSRHPWLEYHPSVGSIFKKIEGVGAGRLIDQCGLKGFRIGGAQISHIHANIIVNLGTATARDVRAVIAHAQQVVAERFDQRLEPEIAFVGDFTA